MICELDGVYMTDRKSAHLHIQRVLSFPEYYGCNLDALYDLLAERGSPVRILIRNWDIAVSNLGGYADMLLNTFREASEENSYVEYEII
jgi:ribonuclease inhibitor